MGRAIMGDIEGKCWFGVQSSDFANRFGVEGQYTHLDYNFSEDDLPALEEELARIEKRLGDNKAKMDTFFENSGGYTDKQLQDYLEVDEDTERYLLGEYADYCRGVEIRECIKKQGYCCFEVEL